MNADDELRQQRGLQHTLDYRTVFSMDRGGGGGGEVAGG